MACSRDIVAIVSYGTSLRLFAAATSPKDINEVPIDRYATANTPNPRIYSPHPWTWVILVSVSSTWPWICAISTVRIFLCLDIPRNIFHSLILSPSCGNDWCPLGSYSYRRRWNRVFLAIRVVDSPGYLVSWVALCHYSGFFIRWYQ